MNSAPLARILIVDDEAAHARALCDTLRDQGYETAGFTSGEDALRALQEKPFDLLLTDLMMPGVDGVALLAAALKIDPQLVGILMTGKGTIETAVQAMKAGALDYILKPFKVSALLPVLARAAGVRQLRLENLELRNTVAIHELNQAIAHTLDPNVLLDKIADAALAQFEADEASVMLLADDGRSLYVAAVRGERRDALLGTRMPIGEGIAGSVAARREPLVLQGEVKDPHLAPVHHRAEIQSALCMPMITRNRLIGVLNVNCIRKRRAFTLGQIKVLSIFTNTAAAGIEAARLYEEQRRTDARYREVLHMAADGIISIDEQQRIVVFNSGAEKLFGYRTEEALGKPLDMLLPEGAVEAHRHHLQTFGQGSDQSRAMGRRGRLFGRRKDGTLFPVEAGISKRSENGKLLYTAVVRDITERNRAEQAMRRLNQELETRVEERTLSLVAARDAAELANRAKDSFLATTSHEIRTPLSGLMGMLELLGHTPLDDEQRETLQGARDSGRSLLRILDDLLDWSKIEEGKLELSPQPTSIAALLAEVVNTYARVASARSLVLEQEVDARLSPVLVVDPLRLSQVLNNFVSNALKFTHAGRVEVRAELLGRGEGTEQVRFSVRDTGIGIAEEVQQRLFQNYGQGSAETARMYGGTGLGLAICRRLADLLDGRIEVESAPGRGSTFSITLSLPISAAAVEDEQRAGEADAAASVLPLVHAGAQTEAPLVLVVDDHPINRRLLAQQLGLLGLRAEVAENGQVALPMWRHGRYALVITDCHMPKMDGYALARSIRRIEAEEAHSRTPIIAWTANALAEEEGRCHAAGMDELLVKPADLTQLRAVLSKWLASGATMAPSPVDAGHDTSGGETAAPIDLAALDQIAASAADRAEILRDFLAQTRSDLTELEAVLKTGDLAASARLAHRMKGACRMVGARELETACEALQDAARRGNAEEARAAQAALDRAMARLEAHLAQIAGAKREEE